MGCNANIFIVMEFIIRGELFDKVVSVNLQFYQVDELILGNFNCFKTFFILRNCIPSSI
ncbi:hypothetical protein PanWU01x14_157870 [Parasponia andersonii]|uniref:Uncharacterized protein n=1 Tax=Parasponia andersonii TaxID=3476 RepID=A0A2P5CF92_PARAD|nr:hypothetical protein PanWU01x14_157870 [Parasponia andersonii]